MPTLPTYQSRVGVAGPRNTARLPLNDPRASALAGFGETVQQTATSLESRFEQRELSKLNAEVSRSTAELSVQLQEELRSADPNDEEFAQRFMQERVGERIGKLRDMARSSAGQSYVEQATARMYGQFLTSSSAGQVQLAGVAAAQNYEDSLNGLSTTTQSDPSTYDFALEQSDASLDALVEAGSISREQSIKLKAYGREQIAKSAAQGWIDINPYRAKEIIAGGRFDDHINGEAKSALIDQADNAISAREVEERRAEAEARQARTDASSARLDALLPEIVQNKVSAMDIANDPDMRQEEKRIALTMIKSRTEGATIRTDPGTYTTLFRRIHAQEGDQYWKDRITDPSQLDQYFGRGLDMEDLQVLRNELTGTRTQAGRTENQMKQSVLDAANRTLTMTNPLLGIRDPKGEEQLVRFTSWFLQEYNSQRNEGVPPMELLDPESDKYLGKGMEMFKRPTSQQMSDLMSQNENVEQEPARPETQEEFDALPKGRLYVDPDDGGLYRKK